MGSRSLPAGAGQPSRFPWGPLKAVAGSLLPAAERFPARLAEPNPDGPKSTDFVKTDYDSAHRLVKASSGDDA
jgi:hypothetical protein